MTNHQLGHRGPTVVNGSKRITQMESANQLPTSEKPLISIDELKAKFEKEKAEIEERLQREADELRTNRVNRRDECIANAETLRQLSRDQKDPDVAVTYVKQAKAAEAEAAELASLLGINEPAPAPEEIIQEEEHGLLSTTKGIWGLIAWIIGTAILFWVVGTTLVQSEDNESATRMMNSVGLRLLTNVLPFSLTFLAVIVFLKLLFPYIYRYWNNRLLSPFSLQQDFEQLSPWQRLAFFFSCVALAAWVFTMHMQVIFG